MYWVTKQDIFLSIIILYLLKGIGMKVKIIDESHEKDLEKSVNDFLEEKDNEIIDIKFQVATAIDHEEQIYCFSAMIIYK